VTEAHDYAVKLKQAQGFLSKVGRGAGLGAGCGAGGGWCVSGRARRCSALGGRRQRVAGREQRAHACARRLPRSLMPGRQGEAVDGVQRARAAVQGPGQGADAGGWLAGRAAAGRGAALRLAGLGAGQGRRRRRPGRRARSRAVRCLNGPLLTLNPSARPPPQSQSRNLWRTSRRWARSTVPSTSRPAISRSPSPPTSEAARLPVDAPAAAAGERRQRRQRRPATRPRRGAPPRAPPVLAPAGRGPSARRPRPVAAPPGNAAAARAPLASARGAARPRPAAPPPLPPRALAGLPII
jgi:hypothetical protein